MAFFCLAVVGFRTGKEDDRNGVSDRVVVVEQFDWPQRVASNDVCASYAVEDLGNQQGKGVSLVLLRQCR